MQSIHLGVQMAPLAIEAKRGKKVFPKRGDALRAVMDNVPAMAWSVLPNGAVDFLNRRWWDSVGVSLQQYREAPTRVIHCDDTPRAVEKWLVAIASGEPYEDEMRLRRADGEYRWFLVRTVPLRDERRNIVRWYGMSTDIEDRKRAEGALRESEDRLRHFTENHRLSAERQAIKSLTSNERAIMRLITDGRSNAEVAELLRLSPRTVETYRGRLMEKLQLNDLVALVKCAIRHGMTGID
jgi:PAS domain S-box-containing protein